MLRRTGDATATALVAVVVLIVLVRLLPGDPLATIMGEGVHDPAAIAALQARYGLNQSIATSIISFFGGLLHGDLGATISDGRPVTSVIAERIGPTLLLGGLTLLIDFTVGLALGVWSALHPDSLRARVVGALTIIGYTVPSFVTGMLLVWLFAVKLSWLPPGAMSSALLATDAPFAEGVRDHLAHLILPLAAMVLATIAVPLRQQRAASLAVATQPWVLAARARGVHPAAVAWRHCWRPALTPIVTLLGLWLPMLVTGAVFVEVVFNWPGMGQLLAQATLERDVNLVIGAGFVVIVMVQFGALLADLIYHLVDPVQRSA